MTATQNLPKTQAATLFTVLPLMTLAEGGEISEYEARTNGANLAALYALVKKGILVARRGEFTMPVGVLAGETIAETFYSVA